ncbi:hypothetical protein ZEAMMB73_Zm00001d031890 [Zea mays]|uniref:Uncharacterized protein n=1 Tax=Zea mays TaxID=4577 RepID=A0A1D6KM05_MAIZE|nr:hypothetical protein ZEAMMB73_Zm00001d031890 [Zea mays]
MLILELIVQLWSKSFATNIFALLFHKWLFEALLTKKKYRYDIALLLFKVLQMYFVATTVPACVLRMFGI